MRKNVHEFDSNVSLFELWTGLFSKELKALAIPGTDLTPDQKEKILQDVREKYKTSLQAYLSSDVIEKEFSYTAKWWFEHFKPTPFPFSSANLL